MWRTATTRDTHFMVNLISSIESRFMMNKTGLVLRCHIFQYGVIRPIILFRINKFITLYAPITMDTDVIVLEICLILTV